jgi:hypothetical protein
MDEVDAVELARGGLDEVFASIGEVQKDTVR